MKTFTYEVVGQEFTGTEAFGAEWKKARALAVETGSEIWRTVEDRGNTRREFFTKANCFLNEKYYTPEKAFH